jgi:hypothetical protein
MRTIGQFLEYEAFGAGLTRHSPKLASKVAEKAAVKGGTLDDQRAYAIKSAAPRPRSTRRPLRASHGPIGAASYAASPASGSWNWS